MVNKVFKISIKFVIVLKVMLIFFVVLRFLKGVVIIGVLVVEGMVWNLLVVVVYEVKVKLVLVLEEVVDDKLDVVVVNNELEVVMVIFLVVLVFVGVKLFIYCIEFFRFNGRFVK